MLMALGFFIFDLDTVPFDSLDRDRSARIASGNRFGQLPAHQFLGLGDETLTLDAVLYPDLTGGPEAVETLAAMMESGKAWILLSGEGAVIGSYIITKIKDTMSVLESMRVGGDDNPVGAAPPVRAKKIVISISLTRDDGPRAGGLPKGQGQGLGFGAGDRLGNLPDSDPQRRAGSVAR